ncbi:hypothetical protein [Terriglobus aquaticus]|uniref:Uncharacterized protein n=1 Tax=Terriglobus aquaticus TaxID=940139 RepID=A0ABW9KGF3_9BACT|nr:hypothetical protein [Terriglobus aquaticus]
MPRLPFMQHNALSEIIRGLLLCLASSAGPLFAQDGLRITYGQQGIQTLAYRGQVLEDVGRYPEDAFHIWHMKSTDLAGRPLSDGEHGWGEATKRRTWNAATHTSTYEFGWGTIVTEFNQQGDTLNVTVTEVNHTGSGIRFAGATLYPFALHFPRLPAGFADARSHQFAFNTTGPSVTVADFGDGEVAAVVPEVTKPLYSGFQPLATPNAYTALVSSTAPDSLAVFEPHRDRSIEPGQTDRFTVSFRFAPSGTPRATIGADAYAAWAAHWPARLHWSDRRIVGTAYLASSAPGDRSRPAGYANNPRRYFNTGDSHDFDIRSADGIVKFQRRVLQQAADIVTNLRRLHAQGVITWDVEGEEYPMNTSYVCAPDQIATIAPEMEAVVQDPQSKFQGMRLDDAYFRTIRDAGFRVGVCVRPQNFVRSAAGSAEQVSLSSRADIAALLIRKMRFAHDRWGATLFYLDSTVDPRGAVLDASIVQQAAAAMPDSLLIPEESTPAFYADTAPFQSFLFHGDLGTPADIYAMYPSAFSANLVNDVGAAQLEAHRAELTEAIRRGDILMVHADSWHPNNDVVLRMVADAADSGKRHRAGAAPHSTGAPAK